MNKVIKIFYMLLLGTTVSFFQADESNEESAEESIDEVIVTATYRETNLMDLSLIHISEPTRPY